MVQATGITTHEVWADSAQVVTDLSAQQFRGVKYTGNRQVGAIAAATDKPAGILLDKPNGSATKTVTGRIMKIGRCPIQAGATLAAGDLLRIGADGKGLVMVPGTDTTAYCVGIVRVGAALDQFAEVDVDFNSIARGA